jgi:hypothetical protein
MSRRTPAPPRGGTSLCWPLTTTATKKWGEIPFTTTSFTGILTQSTVCSMYPNYRPFWYLWHTMHWKKSYILNCKQRQFVADAINHGVKANFSSLQLFDCVWTMVYNNVTYFAMTVYPLILLGTSIVSPVPGRYPATPAWRHIDVHISCNHGRKKWRKKPLHNYFIHRHIDPLYILVNVVLFFWLQKYAKSGV